MSDRATADVAGNESGGDAACWAHLFEPPPAEVVDLNALTNRAGDSAADNRTDDGAAPAPNPSGVVWTADHDGDLNVNLVDLEADHRIGDHANHEVDVLVSVVSGAGSVTVEDVEHQVRPGTLVLVPKGTRRSVAAGPDGLAYLSIHRRRGVLGLSPTRPSAPPSN